jgi:hypothetical protein
MNERMDIKISVDRVIDGENGYRISENFDKNGFDSF